MNALHLESNQNQEPLVLKDTRILVAEDDQSIREFLTFYLEMNGAMVEAVETGVESLVTALEGNFHVVLMDLNLPVMNCESTLLKMRSSGFNRPVLAVSAYHESDRKQKCMDIGFDDYITKPFDLDHLIEKLVFWKNKRIHPLDQVIH